MIMPGWIAIMIAPLYPLFLVALFAFVNQMSGDVLLMIGIGFFWLIVNIAQYARSKDED